MKLPTPLLLLALAASATAALAVPGKNCGCSCCQDRPKGEACCCHESEAVAASPAADAIKRHPLKGVVTNIIVEKSALMVKHEEIPGVMRAMTMMFKVDAATLKSVQKGQAITGQVSRQGSDWVLEDVKIVPAK